MITTEDSIEAISALVLLASLAKLVGASWKQAAATGMTAGGLLIGRVLVRNYAVAPIMRRIHRHSDRPLPDGNVQDDY